MIPLFFRSASRLEVICIPMPVISAISPETAPGLSFTTTRIWLHWVLRDPDLLIDFSASRLVLGSEDREAGVHRSSCLYFIIILFLLIRSLMMVLSESTAHSWKMVLSSFWVYLLGGAFCPPPVD